MIRAALLSALVALAAPGCSGGASSAPSPVGPPAAPAARAWSLPADADATFRTVASVDASGIPLHWAEPVMRHCFGPGIHRDVAIAAAFEVGRLTGIRQEFDATPAACNVSWEVAHEDQSVYRGDAGLGWDAGRGIHAARLEFFDARLVWDNASADPRTVLHELGHTVGLSHGGDGIMGAGFGAGTFSEMERRILAWIYAPASSSQARR